MDEFEDPQWLRALVFGLAALIGAFGTAGLFLAAIGKYSLPVALVLGVVAFAGLVVACRPLFPKSGTTSDAAHICAIVALIAVVGITAWNVANSAQHVLIVRDGGTYLNAGKWLAGHDTLQVDAAVGPFAHNPAVSVSSAGLSRSGDHLNFSLAHFLPVLLAEAQGIGGDGFMFALVPILGGAALLAFYVLARRVLRRPIAALGAMLCLAFLIPQLSFTRDSMTEIPVQVLLFVSIWMLIDRRVLLHRGAAFAAGFLLGVVQALHIDGLAFLVGLPFVGLIVWLRSEPDARRVVGRSIIACGLGVAAGVGLGFLDLTRLGSGYLDSLRWNVERVAAVVVLAVVVAIAIAYRARAGRRGTRFDRLRPTAALLAAEIVAIGGFVAWFARPFVETTHGSPSTVVKGVQIREGLVIDSTRRYFEHALQWVSWYVGPITLTLAIVGAAFAVRSFVRGELRFPSQVVGLVLGPAALLYLWQPSITPDQVWASRRFLPAVFPLVILAGFGLLCVLADNERLGWRESRRLVALLLGLATIAFPLWTITNVSRMTDERGFPPVVEAACRLVGPTGAVIVPQERNGNFWLYGPQTLRSFCDVPVGVMYSGDDSNLVTSTPHGTLSAPVLRRLALDWAREGRSLYIVADGKSTITDLFRGVAVRSTRYTANRRLLDRTLTHRPDTYKTDPFKLFVAKVPLPQQ